MDGLATMGFVSIFGWGAMLATLPVLALQGTITLTCAQYLKSFLEAHSLVDPLNATGGLLVFSVALVILELKKIEAGGLLAQPGVRATHRLGMPLKLNLHLPRLLHRLCACRGLWDN